MIRSLPATVALAVLGGCATQDVSAPSLLPRPIESRSDAEPVRPEPVATPDPTLDAEIAGLIARRDKAAQDFAAADRVAAARVNAGARAAVGSDAWLDAQTALAALDTPRADLVAVVTELEELAIARATAGQPPYPALETAKTETDAVLARITTTMDERKARLPVQ